MTTIILRLEGPLQAWGTPGAAEIRRSHNMPQKRAVLGLIRAAKGLARAETWPELEALDFQVLVLKRPRRMWDFGTMANAVSADGTFIHRQGTQQKEYLADAAFLVALEGATALIHEVQVALEHPVFLIGLGRRDCVPSYPILWEAIDLPPGEALEQARAAIQTMIQDAEPDASNGESIDGIDQSEQPVRVHLEGLGEGDDLVVEDTPDTSLDLADGSDAEDEF
jgi:CRISPR system Cascade subunit CasD